VYESWRFEFSHSMISQPQTRISRPAESFSTRCTLLSLPATSTSRILIPFHFLGYFAFSCLAGGFAGLGVGDPDCICQMDRRVFDYLLTLGLAHLRSLSSRFSHFSFLFLRPHNTSFAPLYLGDQWHYSEHSTVSPLQG
jgi:hypothetical protein